MKATLQFSLPGAVLCLMAAGFMGSPGLAASRSHGETDFVYTSEATVGEAQGILQHLGHLKTGSFRRGVVDGATRDALLAFQRSHALRPTGKVDGETLAHLMQHRPAGRGGALVLTGVRFDTGSARLDPRSLRALDKVARSLKENPHIRIEIAGHADATGTVAANRRLSQARADAVRGYLVGRGVPPSRLEARGYGSERPIADNGTREGRAENRRVEMVPLG
jgi:outer membrane protein OmpA-like peptidoglycan-associated protein